MSRYYQALIREFVPGYDPRHIEAFMRVDRPTLDALSRAAFRNLAKRAAKCVDEIGIAEAEELAKSMGM